MSRRGVAAVLVHARIGDVDGSTLRPVNVVHGRRLSVGAAGFWLEAPDAPEEASPLICSPGAGGAVAWAEPETDRTMAICHDRMFGAVPEDPFAAIVEAIRALTHSKLVTG